MPRPFVCKAASCSLCGALLYTVLVLHRPHGMLFWKTVSYSWICTILWWCFNLKTSDYIVNPEKLTCFNSGLNVGKWHLTEWCEKGEWLTSLTVTKQNTTRGPITIIPYRCWTVIAFGSCLAMMILYVISNFCAMLLIDLFLLFGNTLLALASKKLW